MIDSGSSRHITGFREHLDTMLEEINEEVTIGDDFAHPVKGVGTCTIKLESSITIRLKDVLFALDIKTNLVSISILEDNGYRVTFMDGKFLAWPKNSTYKKAKTIGIRQGYLNKLCIESKHCIESKQTLIHETFDSNEIWH